MDVDELLLTPPHTPEQAMERDTARAPLDTPTLSCNAAMQSILHTQYALHRACRDDDCDTVGRLLHASTSSAGGGGGALHAVLTEDPFCHWMPIHWAAHYASVSCVRQLVQWCRSQERGGRLCGAMVTSRRGQSAVHVAAAAGNAPVLGWLLEQHFAHDQVDATGESPVHKAARAGSMQCLAALFARGASASAASSTGHTAARLASLCSQSPAVAQYVEHAALLQSHGLYPPFRADQPTGGGRRDAADSLCARAALPFGGDGDASAAARKRAQSAAGDHRCRHKRPRLHT